MEIYAIRVKIDQTTSYTYDNTSYYGFMAKTHTIAIIDAMIDIVNQTLVDNNSFGLMSYHDQDFSLGHLYIDRNAKYACYIMCDSETNPKVVCELMSKIFSSCNKMPMEIPMKMESVTELIKSYNKNPKKFLGRLETSSYRPENISNSIMSQLFGDSNKLITLLEKCDQLTIKTKSYLPKSKSKSSKKK